MCAKEKNTVLRWLRRCSIKLIAISTIRSFRHKHDAINSWLTLKFYNTREQWNSRWQSISQSVSQSSKYGATQSIVTHLSASSSSGCWLAVAESVAVSRMPAAEDGRITEGRIKGKHPARWSLRTRTYTREKRRHTEEEETLRGRGKKDAREGKRRWGPPTRCFSTTTSSSTVVRGASRVTRMRECERKERQERGGERERGRRSTQQRRHIRPWHVRTTRTEWSGYFCGA